jgi:hypothetical protein
LQRLVVAISHPLTTEAISSSSQLPSTSWTGIRFLFIILETFSARPWPSQNFLSKTV